MAKVKVYAPELIQLAFKQMLRNGDLKFCPKGKRYTWSVNWDNPEKREYLFVEFEMEDEPEYENGSWRDPEIK